MTPDILNDRYFEWMCSLVHDDGYSERLNYQRLLSYLHCIEFTYILEMDGNRAVDGRDLRYRFAYEHDYSYATIDKCLGVGPCSVLEMMVALALRCEENIMDEPDIGDRTGLWFWNMIANLGLGTMNDDEFNENYTEEIIDKFLKREYTRDGEGGLFTVKHSGHDLREIEIWYQMCWYLEKV